MSCPRCKLLEEEVYELRAKCKARRAAYLSLKAKLEAHCSGCGKPIPENHARYFGTGLYVGQQHCGGCGKFSP